MWCFPPLAFAEFALEFYTVSGMNFSDAAALIRDIPDYPKPGILFRDITPLLADGDAFAAVINLIDEIAPDAAFIAGAEARGFILGSALAIKRGVGFIPLRKPGKLPGQFRSISYGLEYGSDELQVHEGQIPPGAAVLFIDDVLASGGTAKAGIQLLKEVDANVCAAIFLLEINGLQGRSFIANDFPEIPLISLVQG